MCLTHYDVQQMLEEFNQLNLQGGVSFDVAQLLWQFCQIIISSNKIDLAKQSQSNVVMTHPAIRDSRTIGQKCTGKTSLFPKLGWFLMALETHCNARVVWGNKTAINRGPT